MNRCRSDAVAPNLYDFSVNALGSGTRSARIEGAPIDFAAAAKGKVVLLQNVATL